MIVNHFDNLQSEFVPDVTPEQVRDRLHEFFTNPDSTIGEIRVFHANPDSTVEESRVFRKRDRMSNGQDFDPARVPLSDQFGGGT